MCVGPGSGQGQLPRMKNSPGDYIATYRAVPVRTYLGSLGHLLKSVCKLFQASRKRVCLLAEAFVRGGRLDRPFLDQLIGQQQ